MTDYPKNDWKNAVPESDEYDRDELIAFRERLEKRPQNDGDLLFVMSLSKKSVEAYRKLCEAWNKQFGVEEEDSSEEISSEEAPQVVEEPQIQEPKDLKTRIQQRLDRLEQYMKENKRKEATDLIPEISKFWSVLSEGDKDFIQCVRVALEDNLDWDVKN
jgi:putative sterol carrier protein